MHGLAAIWLNFTEAIAHGIERLYVGGRPIAFLVDLRRQGVCGSNTLGFQTPYAMRDSGIEDQDRAEIRNTAVWNAYAPFRTPKAQPSIVAGSKPSETTNDSLRVQRQAVFVLDSIARCGYGLYS